MIFSLINYEMFLFVIKEFKTSLYILKIFRILRIFYLALVIMVKIDHICTGFYNLKRFLKANFKIVGLVF